MSVARVWSAVWRDDMIRTGESVMAIERLIHQAGGSAVADTAILAEGDAVGLKDIICLAELPLFL